MKRFANFATVVLAITASISWAACGESEDTSDTTGTSDTTDTAGTSDTTVNNDAVQDTSNDATGTGDSSVTPDTTAPTVVSTIPVSAATGVFVNMNISANFDEAMDPATITTATFTLKQGTTSVAGAVTFAGTTATFNPTADLAASLPFTATITTGAKDLAGNALASNKVWTFTTGTTVAPSPAPVALGMAGNFVILAKSEISTTGTTAVVGDIGLSPAAATFITGFGLIADSTNVFSTSSLVTGKLFAATYAVPTPTNLTTAVSNMETAYTDDAGRPTPDFSELGSGEIGGLTLVPGLYKWGTDVLISSDVTLNGGPNDVWIFQIAGGITQANGTRVHLTGGALPKNVFWQSFGVVALGTTAHFEGIVLTQTSITLNTGATFNGRLLAQTAVSLKASAVTQPAP